MRRRRQIDRLNHSMECVRERGPASFEPKPITTFFTSPAGTAMISYVVVVEEKVQPHLPDVTGPGQVAIEYPKI